MLVAILLLLAAPTPPPSAGELLVTTQIGNKGAVEMCLTGSKVPGAALLLRVEVWRKSVLLGNVEVPDQDPRAVFAQCRSFQVAAAPGDSLKVYSVGVRPKTITVTPRAAGGE